MNRSYLIAFLLVLIPFSLAAGFHEETFTNSEGLDKVFNVVINGTASINLSKTANISASLLNITQNDYTMFLLTFDNNNRSPEYSSNGNYSWDSASHNTTLTDDCLWGYCLRLYNYSNNASGYLYFHQNNALEQYLPHSVKNFTLDIFVRFENSTELEQGCGLGDNIWYLHSKMSIAQSCGITAKQGTGANRMVSYDTYIYKGWNHVRFVQTQQDLYNETYLFVNGQLVDYQFGKDFNVNDDFGFGMTLGGNRDTNEDIHVTVDTIRIQNRSDFSGMASLTNNTENYTFYSSLIESKSIDTGEANPDLAISWDSVLYHNATDISIMFKFSDDNVTWTNYYWDNAVIAYSQDGGYETASDFLLPKFSSIGKNFTVTFDDLGAGCTDGQGITLEKFELLNASNIDLGAESNSEAVIISDYQNLMTCSPQLGKLRVQRPYFNIMTRDRLKTTYSTGYKINHASVEGTFYSDWSWGGEQCDMNGICMLEQINESINEKKANVITFHNVTDTGVINDSLDWAIANSVDILSVKEIAEKYFQRNNTASAVSPSDTKRYFKYTIILRSGDTVYTPNIDSLLINWTAATTPTATSPPSNATYLPSGLGQNPFLNDRILSLLSVVSVLAVLTLLYMIISVPAEKKIDGLFYLGMILLIFFIVTILIMILR